MTVSFNDRLSDLIEVIRAHPKIEVHGSVVRPPASAEDLEAATTFLGADLPEDLRAFYEAHDGAYLSWGLRGEKYSTMDAFGNPDYGHAPGIINIVPIAMAMSKSWESKGHVNKIKPAQQERIFGAPLDPPPPVGAVCIDNFAIFNHADLILGPAPVMIVSTDHGADMDSSDWVSFDAYLDMTLALYGTNRYSNGIGIGWSRKPEHRQEWSPKRTLDELVASLVADAEYDRK